MELWDFHYKANADTDPRRERNVVKLKMPRVSGDDLVKRNEPLTGENRCLFQKNQSVGNCQGLNERGPILRSTAGHKS